MARSRIALLSRAASVVFGDTTASDGESGWTKNAYHKLIGRKTHVCLNQALSVAERDLFFNGGRYDRHVREGGELYTQEGRDAQQLLAEVICEMYPEIGRAYGPPDEDAHQIIVAWNDEGHATAEKMEELMWKAEDKAFGKWLEDHPHFGPTTETRSFLDSII